MMDGRVDFTVSSPGILAKDEIKNVFGLNPLAAGQQTLKLIPEDMMKILCMCLIQDERMK